MLAANASHRAQGFGRVGRPAGEFEEVPRSFHGVSRCLYLGSCLDYLPRLAT